MAEASNISPYNTADCKNTTDDALQNYLTSLKFKQSHFHTDVKLALGYTAVVISAATFAFDYKLGWEATKYWTAYAVVAYFLLNGAFTYWIWAVEKGVVFTGSRNGKKLTVSSRVDKHDPTYHLTLSTASQEYQVEAPFMRWFTADGFFTAQPFQQWLASSVPLIGEADPKNATASGEKAIGSKAR